MKAGSTFIDIKPTLMLHNLCLVLKTKPGLNLISKETDAQHVGQWCFCPLPELLLRNATVFRSDWLGPASQLYFPFDLGRLPPAGAVGPPPSPHLPPSIEASGQRFPFALVFP